MKIIKSILLVGLLLAFVFQAGAIPAYPYPMIVQQPDGTTLTVILKGDEYHHYYITEDGHLITKDKNNIFNYARISADGQIIDTGIKANDLSSRSDSERVQIANFPKNPDFSELNHIAREKREVPSRTENMKFPTTGSPRSLVILVNFSDVNYVVPSTNQAFTDLLNQNNYSVNGGTGSARDYFNDNSNGTFTPDFDVVGPYTLPQTLNYYGANDAHGNDMNSVQMIVDACRLADENGLDFTIYDTDNNGSIDNVFVYYAGYNEAEGGGSNTIWPHRWIVYPGMNYNGTLASVTFDGKRLFDYACTSELKGANGNNMCGIGTFVHEFGHVLGLPDFYSTNNAQHHTLSFWNVMDAGPYLNQGRTPPSYSAFERFSLGYITPTLISSPQDLSLNPLNTHNEAYLVSSTSTHNLNESNPNPREFFMLENRQKTGWDSYLPGHGMLIHRVNFNPTTWGNNTVNNNPNSMGLDIMEADGIASVQTLAGDPFPGTANVTSYEFILRNGTKIYKQVENVVEANQLINFSFKNVSQLNFNTESLSLTAQVGLVSTPQSLTVTNPNPGSTDINYVITGDDAAMFTTSGNGVLPSSGGTIEVAFAPTSEGMKSAKLIFTMGDNTGEVSLKGITTNLIPNVIITEVYGGGGNTGTTLKNDFIELFNTTNEPVNISQWSIQYYSATGTGSVNSNNIFVLPENSVIPARSHFLIECKAGSGGTQDLPTPDAVSTLALGGIGGKVILYTSGEAQTISDLASILNSPSFKDYVPYGVQALPVWGSATQVVTSTNSVSRKLSGAHYQYAFNIGQDFTVGTPAPNNSSDTISTITSPQVTELTVYAQNGKVFFTATAGETVEIYNMLGQQLHLAPVVTGMNEVSVSAKGVLIVKVGNRVGKVIVR